MSGSLAVAYKKRTKFLCIQSCTFNTVKRYNIETSYLCNGPEASCSGSVPCTTGTGMRECSLFHTHSEPMYGTPDTVPCSPIARALWHTIQLMFDRVASSSAISGFHRCYGARSAIWRRKCHHLWLIRRVVAALFVNFVVIFVR